MQYFGGKSRISKQISFELEKRLLGETPFVDLFCGSCNVISKISDGRIRIANDKHNYLIQMHKNIQLGWSPPDFVSEAEYKKIKANLNNVEHLSGFVGFACSFSGKWWGGYARNKRNDNFCLQSKRSILKKHETMKDVIFSSLDYKDVLIPNGSVVYCDIPYKGTTSYSKDDVGLFSHDEFYSWVKQNSTNFNAYISEYKENIPEGFEIVWELESNKEIRNSENIREKTTEVLIKFKNK